MKRVKKRTDSGAVCEQEIFWVADSARLSRDTEPRERFADDEERRQHCERQQLRNFVRTINESFTTASLYSTLTFSNEFEVHTYAEAKQVRTNFVRRLQYHAPGLMAVIVIGRGKHTHRFHMHMISDGISRELIEKLWIDGAVDRCEPLRSHNLYMIDGALVDCGKDWTGLATYLWEHWTPEQGGHHYKGTRNLRRARAEIPKEIKRYYDLDHPPKPPKGYKLVECKDRGYGRFWYKYVRVPEGDRSRRPPSGDTD